MADLRNLSVAAFYPYADEGKHHGEMVEPSEDGDNTSEGRGPIALIKRKLY